MYGIPTLIKLNETEHAKALRAARSARENEKHLKMGTSPKSPTRK